jgi:hypothetical protein
MYAHCPSECTTSSMGNHHKTRSLGRSMVVLLMLGAEYSRVTLKPATSRLIYHLSRVFSRIGGVMGRS